MPAQRLIAAPLHIGGRLRQARLHRDLQQSEVAKRAALRPDRLNKIEKGRADPRWSEVEAICAALGIEVSTLYGATMSDLKPG